MVSRVFTYNPNDPASLEQARKELEYHKKYGPLGGGVIITEAQLQQDIADSSKKSILNKNLL